MERDYSVIDEKFVSYDELGKPYLDLGKLAEELKEQDRISRRTTERVGQQVNLRF
jgi:hypothetical protein